MAAFSSRFLRNLPSLRYTLLMPARQRPRLDLDSPWKEALLRYLPFFLRFFFPHIDEAIDWSRGYESLDKELRRIMPESEISNRLADTLFKVWLKDGRESWLLIHVEIQAQPEEEFARRMFVYHYRIFDLYNRAVLSLAVLCDDREDWRPSKYETEQFGCKLLLEFPIAKLLDYRHRKEELESGSNPFAAIVLAHLTEMETREDVAARHAWKVRLVKGLYQRGFEKADVQQLFRLIDWLMVLPVELQGIFRDEIYEFEMEKRMPYVTSIERMAEEKGREEGREEGREAERSTLLEIISDGLVKKFGAAGKRLAARVRKCRDIARLKAINRALITAKNIKEVESALVEET